MALGLFIEGGVFGCGYGMKRERNREGRRGEGETE